MPIDEALKTKLDNSEPEIRRYVSALESENQKLQVKIAKLQVQHLSDQNLISALKKELKEAESRAGTIIIRKTHDE